MLFTEPTFLAFVAIVFVAYWGLRRRIAQNVVLVLAGAAFYGWVHPTWLLLLYGTAGLDYLMGRRIDADRRNGRLYVALSVLGNLGLLAYFKYTDFFVENLVGALAQLGVRTNLSTIGVILPVGLSFYTFQSMAYTIDVYRGVARARRNLLDYAVFASFFPQLVAGPIERAGNLLVQVERDRSFRARQVWRGLVLALWGGFKKVAIADMLAPYVDNIFIMIDPPAVLLWSGVLAFAVQLYADFSGYTDIARGVARMLGFELAENFDRPLLSLTAPDFWRRWHKSLSEWIRDYVLVPLLGDSTSYPRFVAATMGAFAIMGLWHGASWNFVLVGLWQGAWVVGHSTISRRWPGWERKVPLHRVVLPLHYLLLAMVPSALMFREHHLDRIAAAFFHPNLAPTFDEQVAAVVTLSAFAFFGAPLLLAELVGPRVARLADTRFGLAFETTFAMLCVVGIFLFKLTATYNFIYFQF
ncbi:MAG: MBOAT family protein [Alphaproteobacteria bacterium]|nr:MBOAT family protein [Alphaproteobacteria bacterium]MCB9696251.1 MBOAT family protein [Alphaproteobacteria bacterium]